MEVPSTLPHLHRLHQFDEHPSYCLIQRQVRLYLQAPQQHVPGNKGLTATPTAAVVLSLFTPVMMVQVQVDKTIVRQVYGWQDHHGRVCDALGIDRAWYETHPT